MYSFELCLAWAMLNKYWLNELDSWQIISYLLFFILFDLYIYCSLFPLYYQLVEFPDGVELIHVFSALGLPRTYVSNVFSFWQI